MPGITAHMIVKNEDRFVGYAIRSALPFVDKFLIIDTGSTDRTIEVIRSIGTPKISFAKHPVSTPLEITRLRNLQISQTKTAWFWVVDGDEIYPESLCSEILSIIRNPKSKISGLVVRRYDLLGDVYHCQSESVGLYDMYGQSGHFSLRLLNLVKLKGLRYLGDYPMEGFYDGQNQALLDYPPKHFVFTKNRYWHAGYLKRSSQGASLKKMFNRQKYKIETGFPIPGKLPEAFYQRLQFEGFASPLQKRSLWYEIAAGLVTPIKHFKRRWLRK